MRCELCGKECSETTVIYKQIAGKSYLKNVCKECAEEHEKHLESLRENFRTQFGDK